MQLMKQAKQLWETKTQRRKDEIKVIAAEYQTMLNDSRYQHIGRPLLEKKIRDKDKAISEITGNTAEEIGIKFIQLNAEKNTYLGLLNAPDNYFRELRVINAEELKLKQGGEHSANT